MPKGKRLIDVIGEQEKSQDWIVKRLEKLKLSIELHSDWGKPDGDAKTNAGWVENKIDEFDGGIVPNREVLNYANILWKKYK